MDPSKPSCSWSYKTPLRESGLNMEGESGTESLQNDAIMDCGEAASTQNGNIQKPLHELGISVEPVDYDPSRQRCFSPDCDTQYVYGQLNSFLISEVSRCDDFPLRASLPNPGCLPNDASLPDPMIPIEFGDESLPIGASMINPASMNIVDITPERSRGVLKCITTEGRGKCPVHGETVAIHFDAYHVLRGNNAPFVSDRKRQCTVFTLGEVSVIPGFYLAVSSMKPGETAFFIVASHYAYGATGYPPHVPPHASLCLHIDMHDRMIEDLSTNEYCSVIKRVFLRGEGSAFPTDGSLVKVRLIGRYKGNFFDRRVIDFTLGEGCDVSIPTAIEKALHTFHLKERSVIYLEKANGLEEYGIPSESPVSYDVTLLSFKKVKQVWEMNSAEKLEKAVASKEIGINYLKVNNFKVALKYFKWIVACLENEPGVDPGTEESRKALLLSGYLNISLCFSKLGNKKDVIEFCDRALKMQPTNEKALFRRGEAKMWRNDYKEALLDFMSVCKFYPRNKAARVNMKSCERQVLAQRDKDVRVYRNMFEIFVKQDQERMKNMKTETGVWQNENGGAAEHHVLSETEMLIEKNNSLLRDANIIELSSNVCCLK